MTDNSIIIEYKNERPIELMDFTNSLASVGEEFKHFAADRPGSDARLYVKEMRSGSVIAELVYWAQQVPIIEEMAEHRDVAAAFMGSWQETLQSILGLTDKSRELPPRTVKNARSFVEPIAKDGGSQVNLIAQDGGQIVANFFLTSTDAAAIGYNASHLLAAKMPEEIRFANEPMILWQVRDGPPSKAGDWGRIDRFSDKPHKLTFASENVKQSITDREESSFGLVFFVSGVVKTAGGKIVAYHILSIDSIAPRDDD